MLFRAFVLTIALLTIGTTSMPIKPSCESKCPVYIQAQGMCFSDGNLYTDQCRADCAKSNLKQLFTCKFPFNAEEAFICETECRKEASEAKVHEQCIAKCPSCESKNSFCGSDGKMYKSECHARCWDNNLTELFTCKHESEAECDVKCKAKADELICNKLCPIFKKKNTICA
jgi:hypothetical protein